jgi:hypothetical protein
MGLQFNDKFDRSVIFITFIEIDEIDVIEIHLISTFYSDARVGSFGVCRRHVGLETMSLPGKAGRSVSYGGCFTP